IVAGSIRDAFGFQREMVVTGMVEIHGNPRFEFAKDLVPLPLRDQLGPMPNDEDEIRELSARDEPWERVVELIDPYYLVRPRYLDEEDARSEQARFDELEQELRQAMQSVPELEVLADHLQIEHAPEGLRIQIVDQARLSMFPWAAPGCTRRPGACCAPSRRRSATCRTRSPSRGTRTASPFAATTATTTGPCPWTGPTPRAGSSSRPGSIRRASPRWWARPTPTICIRTTRAIRAIGGSASRCYVTSSPRTRAWRERIGTEPRPSSASARGA